MSRKIISKQHNSRGCVVCGYENDFSLGARFYNSDNNEVVALIKPEEIHQGYPGRLHGGMAAAILDETIGRVLSIYDEKMWGVTIELSLKYRKPVPTGTELKVVGRLTRDSRRVFEGCGELLLPDGSVAVEAKGKYFKIPMNEMVEPEFIESDWFYIHEDGLEELEL
jgi:acyl-coenzyme A thioesterase PaaI-like protein